MKENGPGARACLYTVPGAKWPSASLCQCSVHAGPEFWEFAVYGDTPVLFHCRDRSEASDGLPTGISSGPSGQLCGTDV